MGSKRTRAEKATWIGVRALLHSLAAQRPMPIREQRNVSSTVQGTLVVTSARGDVLMTAGLDHSVGSVLAFRHLSFARAVCDRSRRFVRGEGTS